MNDKIKLLLCALCLTIASPLAGAGLDGDPGVMTGPVPESAMTMPICIDPSSWPPVTNPDRCNAGSIEIDVEPVKMVYWDVRAQAHICVTVETKAVDLKSVCGPGELEWVLVIVDWWVNETPSQVYVCYSIYDGYAYLSFRPCEDWTHRSLIA